VPLLVGGERERGRLASGFDAQRRHLLGLDAKLVEAEHQCHRQHHHREAEDDGRERQRALEAKVVLDQLVGQRVVHLHEHRDDECTQQ